MYSYDSMSLISFRRRDLRDNKDWREVIRQYLNIQLSPEGLYKDIPQSLKIDRQLRSADNSFCTIESESEGYTVSGKEIRINRLQITDSVHIVNREHNN